MKRKSLLYKEGDWFAVPLRDSGYAAGIVVRSNNEGVILGYFFGPRYLQPVTRQDVQGLTHTNALLIRKCGDTGLLSGKWPIIYHESTWTRSDWPIPLFGRIALNRAYAWEVKYSETDISECISEIPTEVTTAEALPEDGLSGHIALEVRLTKLLST